MTEEKRGINSYSRKANINANSNANTNTNIQILKYKYAWGRGRHVAQGIFARQTNDNLPASSSINTCCKRQYLKSRAEKRIVEMWKIKEKPDRLANQIKSILPTNAACRWLTQLFQNSKAAPHSPFRLNEAFEILGRGERKRSCGNGNI